MQFIDLAAQQERIREKLNAAIQDVLNHGQYIMGPEVKALEERLAEFVGVPHAIGCASGTDALLLALMAHGVGPGDAIFTTPFTFISTAEVIGLLGATPVFVDIDPDTFNMAPPQLELAVDGISKNDPSLYPLPRIDTSEITPSGIIAVDLFGLPADYDAIKAIADKYDLFVVQDAAQSFGAEYKGGKTCGQGHIGCTSFFPAKPLGSYGDGGMCFTRDEILVERIRSLRLHGKGIHRYENVRIGINGRLDTIQAAVLLTKMEIFPEEIEMRQRVADRYSVLLQEEEYDLKTPQIPSGFKSAWAQYSVLARDGSHRSAIQATLKENGIPTAIYYPVPLHLQKAFEALAYQEADFPVSEDFSKRIFSLPMHPYLKEEDQRKIVKTIASVRL